ncbi:MAG: NAD(P)-binding protein [Proteobacteria bacterium]|nr:NAD(P)-binding protein [Pseudomonadota bacterium]
MKNCDCLVIGGGISGLSFAWWAATRGREVLVVDGASRLGGCLHSHRLDDEFWLDLGAHTCYNSYGGLLEILEQSGTLGSVLAREKAPFRLWRDGRLRSVGREISKREVLTSCWRIATARKEGATVAEYYGKLVGRGNYERVLTYVLAAVPSQVADDFPATMLFKKRPRRKDIRRSFTFRGGLQTATDAMASHDRIEIRTGFAVDSVAKDGAGFVVHSVDGEELRCKALVVAAPPSVGAQILAGAFPEVASTLGRIAMTAVETLGVVVESSKLDLERVAGIVPVDDCFFSAVSRDTVPGGYRGFAFHFRPGVRREAKLGRVADILGLDDFVEVAENEVALPSPVLGHQDITRRLDELLVGKGLYLTGNYFAGLAIEDCVQRSRQEVERLNGRSWM